MAAKSAFCLIAALLASAAPAIAQTSPRAASTDRAAKTFSASATNASACAAVGLDAATAAWAPATDGTAHSAPARANIETLNRTTIIPLS